MKKGFLCTVLCAAAISGLVASACFPQLSAQAKGSTTESNTSIQDLNKTAKEEMASQNMDDELYHVIVYELGDPNFHVPAKDGNNIINTIMHDLNMSEEEAHAFHRGLFPDDFYYERPIIIYELEDDRIPAIDWDSVDNMHILEEVAAREDYTPDDFYNLAFGAYNYRFSNVEGCVYTDAFPTNGNGYISISTSGINNLVYIAMIERDSGQVVNSWEGDPTTISGLGFPGSPTKIYYFMFVPYGETSLSGSGNIFWEN